MKITMNTLDGVTLKTKNKYVNEDIAVSVDQAVVDGIYQDAFNEGVASVPPNKMPSLIDGSLTELTAEDLKGITTIKDYAFAYVTGLTSVTIPNTVTSIGGNAFYYSPIEVKWEDNSTITEIGKNAFTLYLGINLIIPNSVTTIGENGIYRCDNLTSLEIPNNVTTIGKDAMRNNGFTSLTIGSGVTSIGQNGFSNNANLTTVIFAENSQLKSLGVASFQNCSKLESIAIPNGVTMISAQTFQNCNALSSVTISPDTTYIGSSAFQNCTSLTEFTIPNTVQNIVQYAFAYCTSLTSLIIPASVTQQIGSNALAIGSSTNKGTITFLHTTPPNISSSTFKAEYLEKIIVPKGCGDAYKAKTNWSNFAEYIVESET